VEAIAFYKTAPLKQSMKQNTKPLGIKDFITIIGIGNNKEKYEILKKIGEKLK
jgi:hypothetical protein